MEGMIEKYRTRAEEAQDKERDSMNAQNALVKVRETLDQHKSRLEGEVKDLQSKLNACATELASYRNAYQPPTNKKPTTIQKSVAISRGQADGRRAGGQPPRNQHNQ